MVSRCLAGTRVTRRQPVAMGRSPSQSRQHRGHMHRHHQPFCLLSDLTLKMTSYNRQTSPHSSLR